MLRHLILIVTIFTFLNIQAQTPQALNYQAVARNTTGAILANQSVGIRISITDGSAGATLFQETHTVTTNQFGLFTLGVGNGTVVSGIFSSIPWATITPWLQVEMDPAGGSAYVMMGSSALLSVPYALQAQKANTSDVATNMTLNDLTDVNSTSPSSGQVLKYNGTNWVPSLDSNNTYTAGSGINVAGNVISNTGDLNSADDITNSTSANGDLSGTYPNPTVAKIRGAAVSTTAPTNGQVLKYNGTQYVPSTDNNTSYTQGTGINISGSTISNTVTTLDNLSDVTTTGAASGQVLKYNGTNWIPGTDNTSSSSGGVNSSPRLSGDGTLGFPLDIAQQGASSGQVLQWNGTSWSPGSGATGYWTANGNNITNSNTGNIGIGTSTPQSKLDVNGILSLNDFELRLRSGNNADHGLKYDPTIDGPYLFGYNGGALGTSGMPNSLEWSFTGDVSAKNNFYTEHSIIVDDASANTGSLSNSLTFGNGSGEGIASNRNAGVNRYGLDLYTGSAKRISIANSGLVGIGTAAPTHNLQVHNSTTATSSIQLTNNFTDSTTLDGGLIMMDNDELIIVNQEPSKIKLRNGGVDRLTVSPFGFVGIGTTTPLAKLDVNGNTNINGTLKITDGTEGAGKVLTSDASGNGSWQTTAAEQVVFKAQLQFNSVTFNGVYHQIIFDSVFVNNGNGYNETTGNFTAPSPGLYYFHSQLVWQTTSLPHTVAITLGSSAHPSEETADISEMTSSNGDAVATITSGIFYLNAGDIVKVWASEESSGDATVVAFSGRSNFFGYKIY
ncbi:MAG: hypothetical protein IPP86_12845 [Bacteroidetes bacterium]|nr:hypothetical protein [Bacteroidota bacterium]